MKYKIDSEDSRTVVMRVLSKLPIDPPVEVTIGEWKDSHSREQENKWHSMLGDLSAAFVEKGLGYTREETKSIVKYKLGLYKELTGNHGTVIVYENTHGRSKEFYSDLIEQTYMLAAEWGIMLE